jgi:indole-3-glycerol phosphate synthase
MILDKIVDRKKEEVEIMKNRGIHLPPEFMGREIAPPRGFRKALLDFHGVAVIAEAKKASPSKGVLCENFNIEEIVSHYESSGAQALSVLTDVDFFQGSLAYLLRAREKVNLPVLRKDFIIDELQIHEASVHGADAVLLIAAILDDYQLNDYFSLSKELLMDVLVEVHDEKEMERSLRTECNLIGVNNRNLNDFTVDINTTFRLKRLAPKTIPIVSESGLQGKEDMQKLHAHGITAALIGETLMRAGNDSSVLSELRT